MEGLHFIRMQGITKLAVERSCIRGDDRIFLYDNIVTTVVRLTLSFSRGSSTDSSLIIWLACLGWMSDTSTSTRADSARSN